MTVTGKATWIRSGDRTIEGWVHRPAGDYAVGALVIAPSIGQESQVSYRSLRALATTAAEQGRVVVRFAWSGQGDSEPTRRGDLVAAWREDLSAAVRLAQQASGVSGVDVIGFRVGAAVVASVRDAAIRSRILWEPIGGRTFLRQQAAMRKVALPSSYPMAATGVELCSYHLDERAAASVRGLGDPGALAPEALPANTRVVREADEIAARLYQVEQLLTRVPLDSIRVLIRMLEAATPFEIPRWAPVTDAVIVDGRSGERVRQVHVEVGPNALPGIYSVPLDVDRWDRAALIIPAGGEAKGVNRIWPPASRSLAARGVPNLRADCRGFGDAADAEEVRDPNLLGAAGAEDVREMAAWLRDHAGAPMTAIGVCAGAWRIARAAASGCFARVVMINNQAWRTSSEFYRQMFRAQQDAPLGMAAGLPGAVPPATPDARVSAMGRLKYLVRHHAPYPLRRLLAHFDLLETVDKVLAPVPRATSVRVVYGPEDWPWFETIRGGTGCRRLAARGRRVTVEFDPRPDHALVSHVGVDAVTDLLDSEFPAQLTPTAAPRAADPAQRRIQWSSTQTVRT
jgi:hypothetical protein